MLKDYSKSKNTNSYINYNDNKGNSIGSTIKYLRNRENLSVKELSNKVGIRAGDIYKIESDNLRNLDWALEKLFDFFRVNEAKNKEEDGRISIVKNTPKDNFEYIEAEEKDEIVANRAEEKEEVVANEVKEKEEAIVKETIETEIKAKNDNIQSNNSLKENVNEEKIEENSIKPLSMMELGILLKEKRLKKGMDMKVVAENANLSLATLYKIESGAPCQINTYEKLCNYFSIDLEVLKGLGNVRGAVKNKVINLSNKSESKRGRKKGTVIKSKAETNEDYSDEIKNSSNYNNDRFSNIEDMCNSKLESMENDFFEKLKTELADVQISRNHMISYGVEIKNVGYTPSGSVYCYYPIFVEDKLEPNVIRDIKMEYFLFRNEFEKINKPEMLKFNVYIICESLNVTVHVKELLYDIFQDYEGFVVNSYSKSDLKEVI